MIFRDRKHAAIRLAAKLRRYREDRPIVIALPPGGVCVGFEVARALRAQLDVIAVHELDTPDYREYAIGAIAEGGGVYVDGEALRAAEMTEEDAAVIAEQELSEVTHRARAYRGDRPLTEVAGQTVILVDEGAATGARARAGGQVMRGRGAARVVLAAPVIAARAAAAVSQEFDDVVAVELPSEFIAVEHWYERFPEVSDGEAVALLRRARHWRRRAGGAEALWDEEWLDDRTLQLERCARDPPSSGHHSCEQLFRDPRDEARSVEYPLG
jgi:putative phosphoribosyl transferase